MATLYVSDLDGTLLQSDGTLSDYTSRTVNALVKKGMLFSYATARSYETARKVTAGLDVRIPLAVYNGAMVVHHFNGAPLIKNFFDAQIGCVLKDLLQNGVYPIVYAFIDGEEKFSYVRGKENDAMRQFIQTREGDRRANAVEDAQALYRGDIFYLSCIEEKEETLRPFYDRYSRQYRCLLQTDFYTRSKWLEMMPAQASKANAAKQLKQWLHCEKLIVFGDGANDIDLFEAADEAYAVGNAAKTLKCVSTAVIGSNDENGVANWLLKHYKA